MTPVNRRAALRASESLEDLLEFLRDQLDWPIPEEMGIEDAGVRVDPEEIHLDPKSAARMDNVYRLLPPIGDEPFGVYFVQFSPGRFPVGAVKRLLERVVRKRRSSRTGHTGRWGKNDLIFVTRTEDGGIGRAHLTAFDSDPGTNRTRVKVISWSKNDTDARIERLVAEELPCLRWPDSGQPMGLWLDKVRQAFKLGVREEIKTSEKLAQRMAEVAMATRDEVLGLLEVELASGPLRSTMRRIRETLLADVDERKFANIYAQTLVYGLLVARLTNREKFDSDVSSGIVDFGTPLLDALYKQFREPGTDINFDELGLVDLALELRDAPVEQILDNFGAADRRDDPVVHFYEDFLDLFDRAERKELGEYYTVVPVVDFMVRAVDDVLRSEFGLKMGVADAATWSDVSSRFGCPTPTGIDPSERFVRVVDPATGTGTFLLAWLRIAKQSFMRAGGSESDWAIHLERVVLPYMTGLEINLAPYAVAHLKMALEIPEGVNHGDRLPIFLTNTMLPAKNETQQLEFFDDPLAIEGQLADAAKADSSVTVIIGNPPWKDKVKGEGPIVEATLYGRERPLLDDFTPAASRKLGAHTKILRNRYVFFWRWALHRVFGTPLEKPGVVVFITPSAWLKGPVFEEMRKLVREGNKVWVVDLGGDLKNNVPGDENVFSQITTASAICIVVRTPLTAQGGLYFKSLQGSRSSKFEWLAVSSIMEGDWVELSTTLDAAITDVKDDSWMSHIALGELMPFQANGIHQQRTWVNDPNKAILKERWQKLANARVINRPELMKETASRTVSSEGEDLDSRAHLGAINQRINSEPASIVRYSFRTLDRQWLLADSRVIDRPSPELWAVRGKKQFFFNQLAAQPTGTGPAVVVAGYVPNMDHFKGNSGGSVLPAFRDANGTLFNILPGLCDLLSKRTGTRVDDGMLVSYIAGLAAFPAFSKRFSGDLREGGVRIPLTLDYDTMRDVSALGSDAIELFTYCERTVGRTQPRKSVRVSDGPRLVGDKNSLRICPDNANYDPELEQIVLGEIVIGNVPASIWAYEVSGMPVVKKWLGYRKAVPTTKWSSPLNEIVTTTWPKVWTEELLDLLNVIAQLRSLENQHEVLLGRVLEGPMLTVQQIKDAGLLPPPLWSTKPASRDGGLAR